MTTDFSHGKMVQTPLSTGGADINITVVEFQPRQSVNNLSDTAEGRERLKVVFDLIITANRIDDHWKAPIDATIPSTAATVNEITQAVAYFTASIPTVKPNKAGTSFRIRAAGYWNTVGM